jgi:eukaryotic-like serine/threonine-protein kinase
VLLVWVVGYERSRVDEGMLLAAMAESAVVRAGDRPDLRARLENHVGLVHYAAGEHARARERFENALASWDRLERPNPVERLDVVNNLGLVCGELGEVSRATEFNRETIAGREELIGADHPDLAIALANQGTLFTEVGRFAEAAAHLERALAIQRRHARVSEIDVAVTHVRSARLGERRRDLAGARAHLASARRMLADHDDARLAMWLDFTEARILLAEARPDLAAPLLRRVRAEHAALLGEHHLDGIEVEETLVAALLASLEAADPPHVADPTALDEPARVLEHALSQRLARLPPEHFTIGLDRELEGRLELLRGERARARAAFVESIRIREAVFDPADPDLAGVRARLARLDATEGAALSGEAAGD